MPLNKIDYEATKNVPIALTKYYESGEQTITVGGQLVLNHSFNTIPKIVSAFLVCKIADAGYSVGDIDAIDLGASDGSASWGLSVVPTSTNLTLRIGAVGRGFIVIRKDTGVIVDLLATANWRLIVRAWA